MKQRTITEEEESVAEKAYGRDAKPTLFEDKSIEGLIRANCGDRSESAWRRFAKQLIV